MEIFAEADLGKDIFLEADFGKDFMANDFFFVHAMSFWLDDCNCEFEKKIVNLMIVVGPSRVKLKCTPVHE